ncbi:hypothetical protein BJ508DRAFT_60595 [Ascobolus immersus RN42]|uniref:Uncharacterized protein n=1 Tax=Ascobolus immersus RN42 TaxID=1160509 RepID=A0A3N4IRW1_ASCIM|nr:hypothetical protein BJ508DRAFT_60595 [Ascobolus immersus RN42]
MSRFEKSFSFSFSHLFFGQLYKQRAVKGSSEGVFSFYLRHFNLACDFRLYFYGIRYFHSIPEVTRHRSYYLNFFVLFDFVYIFWSTFSFLSSAFIPSGRVLYGCGFTVQSSFASRCWFRRLLATLN